MIIIANYHKYIPLVTIIIATLNTGIANVSKISDDEAKDNSSKSEEIERRDGHRDGHRKIHIITVKKVKDVDQKVAICDLQHKRGPCNENHDRYYYDVEAHKCNHFNWGGCEPNKNNFKTRNECEHACLRRGNNRETIDVHTKRDYRPPPVRKHDTSLKKERCHGKLLGHCEDTKHDWGRDISRNCKVPRNFESFEEYRNSEWFACASTFSKDCTDCLCQIHSMRKVLDYEVPCCHGKCKGKATHGWETTTPQSSWKKTTTPQSSWKKTTTPQSSWKKTTTKRRWAAKTTKNHWKGNQKDSWDRYKSSEEYRHNPEKRRNHNSNWKGWNKPTTKQRTWTPSTVTSRWEVRTTKSRWEPTTLGWKSTKPKKENDWKTTAAAWKPPKTTLKWKSPQEPVPQRKENGRWKQKTTTESSWRRPTTEWRPKWEDGPKQHTWSSSKEKEIVTKGWKAKTTEQPRWQPKTTTISWKISTTKRQWQTTKPTTVWKSKATTTKSNAWHQKPTTTVKWVQSNDYIEDTSLNDYMDEGSQLSAFISSSMENSKSIISDEEDDQSSDGK